MGESKRRKSIELDYGKPKQVSQISDKDLIERSMLLATLLGIELWRKENLGIDWRAFFRGQVAEAMRVPGFDGGNVRSKNDRYKAIIGLLLTILTSALPPSLLQGQSAARFLAEKLRT